MLCLLDDPTPAGWPKGGTLLLASGPCLSLGELGRSILCLASLPSNEARRGVNGFGPFCRNKRGSAAGPRSGANKFCTLVNRLGTFLLQGNVYDVKRRSQSSLPQKNRRNT